jgi:hypothetical protein
VSDDRKRFADRLIAADPPSAAGRARYERELKAMFETTLTPRTRGAYLAGALALFAVAGFFGLTAALAPELKGDFVPFVVAYFVLTAAAAGAGAALMARGFWGGSVRKNGPGVAGIGVLYLGLSGWVFLLMGRHVPETLRDDVRVLGLMLVIYAAVAWVRHRIARAETATAVRILELELQIAEMTRRGGKAEGDPGA